ncbi:MAG: lysophospholipid acyltransferase family protein [Candidatus Kapaibacterium sp.]
MIRIKDFAINAVLVLLGGISRFAGFRLRSAVGKLAGKTLIMLSPKRKIITKNNIEKAFPDKDPVQIREILIESYENLGITLMEQLAIPTMDEKQIKMYIKYENLELLTNIYKRGKGMILMSGHYGNWELLALSAGLFTGIPVNIIVKRQKNPFADKLVNNIRTKFNNKVIQMRNAARKMIEIMNKGEALALLADQSAHKDKDIYVEFFGRPVSVFEAPSRLALRYRVPIVIGFAERQENGTYYVRLKELDCADLEYNDESVRELSRMHVNLLEEQIRKKPGQWAWQHRRWKHTDYFYEHYTKKNAVN